MAALAGTAHVAGDELIALRALPTLGPLRRSCSTSRVHGRDGRMQMPMQCARMLPILLDTTVTYLPGCSPRRFARLGVRVAERCMYDRNTAFIRD